MTGRSLRFKPSFICRDDNKVPRPQRSETSSVITLTLAHDLVFSSIRVPNVMGPVRVDVLLIAGR